MRICIVGAGAIGGYLGARLSLAGEEVTLIARGAHLDAIRRDGLTLIDGEGNQEIARPSRAVAVLEEVGPQDVVIVALKAHSVPSIAPSLRSLYDEHTLVVTAQNGVPWWYFRKLGGEHEGRRIEAVDPGGIVESNIDVDRVIGAVVYPAAELAGPGVVRHVEGDRFSLGELDGNKSVRVRALSEVLVRAGLKAPISSRIRWEIWIKLWGNLAFNPISALTRATLEDICRYPLTRALATTMMLEAQAIAHRLGIDFGIRLEQRIDGAERVGAHKTSMLQDIEAGRPTEVDAIVGAVAELGRIVGVPTPAIDAIYAVTKLLETTTRR